MPPLVADTRSLLAIIQELTNALLIAENQCQTLRAYIGMDVSTMPSIGLMLRAGALLDTPSR